MATTQQLVNRIREKLNDIVEPFLFSDGKIYDALTRAQRSFAERTLCLQRSIPLALQAQVASYPLDPYVMKLRRIVTASNFLIQPRTVSEMDLGYVTRDYGLQTLVDWRTLVGQPRFAVTDLGDRTLRLVPIPEVDDAAFIEAYVYPADLDAITEPEIPLRWSDELLAGALMNLYRVNDMELYDPREAQAWEQRWGMVLYEAVGALERDQRGSSAGRFNSNGVW